MPSATGCPPQLSNPILLLAPQLQSRVPEAVLHFAECVREGGAGARSQSPVVVPQGSPRWLCVSVTPM